MSTGGFTAADVQRQNAKVGKARRVGQERTTLPQKRRSKYGATPTTVDGIRFDSAKEAKRYGELKLLWELSLITDLELQPEFVLWAHPNGETHAGAGIPVGKYRADFRYYTPDGEIVIEDVKGMRTPLYRLKKRIVEAQYGIKIRET